MALKINDVEPWVRYSVGGTPQSAFAIPFEFFTNADIVCIDDTVVQVLSTDYTLVGAGVEGGGTLTFVTPVSNSIITIYNDIAIKRTTNFPLTGQFNIASLNTQLNKIIAIELQLERIIAICIKADEEDDITGVEMTMPAAATRANKLLGFDANGDVIVTTSTVADIESGATAAAAALAAINAKITISTSAPSGGSDGDIWYRVTA